MEISGRITRINYGLLMILPTFTGWTIDGAKKRRENGYVCFLKKGENAKGIIIWISIFSLAPQCIDRVHIGCPPCRIQS